MTTYARIVGGYAVDVVATPPELKDRFNAGWLAQQVFLACPVDTLPGRLATINPDGSVTWGANPPPVPPIGPNNPGNPYFGKARLGTKDFYALAGKVLGARYPRLRTDQAFLWVNDVLSKVDVVDPDDKKGLFLQIITYLQNTNASDAKPLMSALDVQSFMAAWPSG